MKQINAKKLHLNTKIYVSVNDNKPILYIRASDVVDGHIAVLNTAISAAIQEFRLKSNDSIEKIEFITNHE